MTIQTLASSELTSNVFNIQHVLLDAVLRMAGHLVTLSRRRVDPAPYQRPRGPAINVQRGARVTPLDRVDEFSFSKKSLPVHFPNRLQRPWFHITQFQNDIFRAFGGFVFRDRRGPALGDPGYVVFGKLEIYSM